jgi:hypothetical protein
VVFSAEIDLTFVEMVGLRQIPNVGLVRTLMTFIECEKARVESYIEGRTGRGVVYSNNIY